MWVIVTTCLAVAANCQSVSPAPDKAFATKRSCNAAIVKIAGSIDPGHGAYAFRCERAK